MLEHTVAQVRMVFRPIWDNSVPDALMESSYFVYVQRFDIVPRRTGTTNIPQPSATRDPYTGMYLLKRASRADGTRLGGVLPLQHLCTPIEVTPRFGGQAHHHLKAENALEFSTEFWLNDHFDKEDFYALY